MIEVAIMIEGQIGLTWPRWQRISQAVEDLGFVGIYRSDHYTRANPPDLDSLELWVSLTWLASHTKRIEFGPLVTPMSFRHPTMTARYASAIDDLSGGRLTLGLGAGWQKREHENYGFELLDLRSRFNRFEEGLKIITKLLKSDIPINFEGEFYKLKDAILLPRPQRAGGPQILIGGNGEKRTLPFAVHYANEWNALFKPAYEIKRLNIKLDNLLRVNNRHPNEIRRSLMTQVIYGYNSKQLSIKLSEIPPELIEQRGYIVGTANEIVDQLGKLNEAGVQRVMLEWEDLDDLEGLEHLAKKVLPQLR